jgi:hypothetical protein
LRLKEQQYKKKEEDLRLKEEELRLKDLEERRIIEARIIKENRIKEENERIKEWEIKFDADQKRKEEELIAKFAENNRKNANAKENELNEEVVEDNKSIN